MKKSELIIWICETRDEVAQQHPDWSKEQVREYVEKVKVKLFGENPVTE